MLTEKFESLYNQLEFIFSKSFLNIFRPRPPFLFGNIDNYPYFFKFKLKLEIKKKNYYPYRTSFSSKMFSSNAPKYSSIIRKKGILLKPNRTFPFSKKNFVLCLKNINKKYDTSLQFLKKVFSINFSRFLNFQTIFRWKNFFLKKKIKILIELRKIKIVSRKNEKFLFRGFFLKK